jgi:Ni,Fe-hydrogenase III large subunit
LLNNSHSDLKTIEQVIEEIEENLSEIMKRAKDKKMIIKS